MFKSQVAWMCLDMYKNVYKLSSLIDSVISIASTISVQDGMTMETYMLEDRFAVEKDNENALCYQLIYLTLCTNRWYTSV